MPVFVHVTNVSVSVADVQEYVISNEVTGRHFSANEATVALLDSLRLTGSLEQAIKAAGLDQTQAGRLVDMLSRAGVIVRRGETQAKPAQVKPPLESRLIMMRWDLLSVTPVADRLAGLGRWSFSVLGFALWCLAIATTAFLLIENGDKVKLTMAQTLEADIWQWLVFALLFVGLKVIHELGHVLAYQQMMRREGLDPGPIRVGICIFAGTPFPFTDVTGAWQLRSRARRFAIGAGGVYFETWAMAILTVIWAQTSVGLFQTVALQVAVVSGAVAILFNLNPAVKLDGYFIVTDLLRQPNLAARASMAARRWVARRMGASLAAPNVGELAYWLVSYAYRWTIFAGIFWLIFQIDPRLAQIAGGLVVLTLLVRPMIATVRFVRQSDARPIWAATFLTCLVGWLALLVVPFENRLLMAGNVIRYETQDRIATEPARLVVAHDGRVSLHSPALDQRIADLEFHGALLENARGASFASPTELARMQAEQYALQDALTQLAQRKSRLVLASQQDIWTNASARAHNAAWVTSRSGRLGSVSVPVAPSIRLTFAQTSAIAEHLLTAGTIVDVRSHLDPSCMFQGRITTLNAAQVAREGLVTLDADPVSPADSCFEKLPNGARLVARAVMPDRALFYRAWLALAQTLQNRLPI